jgi:hypothetical protein
LPCDPDGTPAPVENYCSGIMKPLFLKRYVDRNIYQYKFREKKNEAWEENAPEQRLSDFLGYGTSMSFQ